MVFDKTSTQAFTADSFMDLLSLIVPVSHEAASESVSVVPLGARA